MELPGRRKNGWRANGLGTNVSTGTYTPLDKHPRRLNWTFIADQARDQGSCPARAAGWRVMTLTSACTSDDVGSPTTASWTTLPLVCESLETRRTFEDDMLGMSLADATRAAEAAELAVSVLEEGEELPHRSPSPSRSLFGREKESRSSSHGHLLTRVGRSDDSTTSFLCTAPLTIATTPIVPCASTAGSTGHMRSAAKSVITVERPIRYTRPISNHVDVVLGLHLAAAVLS